MVDIMLDSGIELLIMAVNPHLGAYSAERPSVFRWRGPSGRFIKVMNGAHYTMFDQLLKTHKNDLAEMNHGLQDYLNFLEKKQYPYDFIYLTATNAPVCYDNSPPNFEVSRLIRRWNDEGRSPVIRYVTPELLLRRIDQIAEESLPVLNGDWTDYWNFGCASNAAVTKINLNTKPRLYTREMLAAFSGSPQKALNEVSEKAWWHLNLYDEHTWGSYNSMDFDNIFSKTQAHLKDALAYNARELTEYLLVNELETLSGNPASSYHQEGLLMVNASSSPRREYIPLPEHWPLENKRLRTARFAWNHRYKDLENAPLYGPVVLEPFSWKMIPFKKLKKAPKKSGVIYGQKEDENSSPRLDNINFDTVIRRTNFIESPFYRLEYETPTGRITGLWDKERNWQILDLHSLWTFFEVVQETPDSLVDSGRTAYYARNMDKERHDISCWRTDWKAHRRGAGKPLECEIETRTRGITLVLKFEAPGINELEQRITLLADSPLIELAARFNKKEVRTAESIYFTFPLNLSEGWQCHFNTAGIPLKLDAEQLPGSSRDWVTVESFVSVHSPEKGVTLYCPDAPMVQVGDFNFGRRNTTVNKREHPILLAWPLNNYWDTNFRASQPGFVEIRYYFRSHGRFDALKTCREGKKALTPIEIHPAINCKEVRTGKFFNISGETIEVLHVKPAESENGIISRIVNLGTKTAEGSLSVPSKELKSAFFVNPLEENQAVLPITNNEVVFSLEPGRIMSLKLEYE
jgi:hypothetical protein